MTAEKVRVGYFQWILIFLLGINYLIVSMNDALPGFNSYTPNFYCKVRGSSNATNKCPTNPSLSSSGFLNNNNSTLSEYSSCETGYRFDLGIGETTIVTEWGLICERSYLLPLSSTIYFFGVIIGAWIAGVLADRVGRLPVLAMCLYTQGTLAVALYIIQDLRAFLVVRGLQGLFVEGLQISTYTLLIELFPMGKKNLVPIFLYIFYATGLILLSALSYAVSDWRVLQLATSVPTAVTVLYIWIIPESPRWLFAKDKLTEAHMALEKIGKYNNCCFLLKSSKLEDIDDMENCNDNEDNPNFTTITESVTTQIVKQLPDIKDDKIGNDFCNEEAESFLNHEGINDSKEDKIGNEDLGATVSSDSLDRRISNLEIELGLEIFRDGSDKEENEGIREKSVPIFSQTENENDRDNRSSSIVSKDNNEEIITDLRTDVIIELKNIPGDKNNEEENIDRSSELKEKKIINETDIEGKNHLLNKDQSFINLMKRSKLRRNSLAIIFLWFSISFSYFGVFRMPIITKDRHLNFAIGGSFDLIAYSITYLTLIKFQRRFSLSIYFIITGTICIVICAISLPIHQKSSWSAPTKIFLTLIGKFSIASTFPIISISTVETFPTVLRSTGFGFGEIGNKIGSFLAPQLLILGATTSFAVPTAIIGSVCIASGILSLSLPNTLRSILPDTIDQSEYICSNNNNDDNNFNNNNSNNDTDKENDEKLSKVDDGEDNLKKKINRNNRKKRNNSKLIADELKSERDIIREKLFSDDSNGGNKWVDAGNGIIVNFSDN